MKRRAFRRDFGAVMVPIHSYPNPNFRSHLFAEKQSKFDYSLGREVSVLTGAGKHWRRGRASQAAFLSKAKAYPGVERRPSAPAHRSLFASRFNIPTEIVAVIDTTML